MSSEQPKLGIIAGRGDIPGRIAEACIASGRGVFIVGLEGFGDESVISPYPNAFIRMGAAGEITKRFKAENVNEIVLAGPVDRPTLSQIRPDMKAAAMLAKIGTKAVLGDDNFLSAIIGQIEAEGFSVIGIHQVLGGFIAKHGAIAGEAPDEQTMGDIDRGLDVLAALSPVDVGQAVVVQEGLILGVEAIEGTDALIRRCGDLRRDGRNAILVKMSKTGQERRVDMPTIGVETINLAAENGFAGIAIEAGNSLIIDPDAVKAACQAAGLFLYALDPRE